MSLFKGAKKDSFEVQVKEILKSGESTWMSDSMFDTSEITYSRINGSACGRELKLNGNSSVDYIISFNKNGKITSFNVTYKTYQYSYFGNGLVISDISSSDIKEVASITDTSITKMTCQNNNPVTFKTTLNDLETENADLAETISGQNLNAKMESLAGSKANITKILRSATEPSEDKKGEANLITLETSPKKAYMWFDSTDGTIYWWSEVNTITLNQDSTRIFAEMSNLEDISSLQDFDTSKVENFSFAFYLLSKLSSFEAIKYWDVSNATDINSMFVDFGINAPTFTLNLSNWNTSNVTNMLGMFSQCGLNATTFSLNLSNWNTSNVTDMSYLFGDAGGNSTTWSVTIPKTNGNGRNNTTSRMYGNTSSIYIAPPSGRTFTLAQ